MTYNNVSDMKLAPNSPNTVIETLGYYSPGDLGHAKYLVKTPADYGGVPDGYGDHVISNGNIAELIPENQEVNVEQYGAGISNTNDKKPHIEAALEKHYTVRLHSKTYLVSSVQIKKHGQRLLGSSQYGSFFKGLNSSSENYLISTNNKSGLRLSDIRIEANSILGKKGVKVENTYYSTFINVDVRGTMEDGWHLINSNNNVFNVCQAHNTSGLGIFLDQTSQHNTFNSCGAEDFVGHGFSINGIGNIFTSPWIENRNGLSTDTGIRVNNRDNVFFSPEIRGSNSVSLAIGIDAGSFSGNLKIVNPHFADVAQDIKLTGNNLHRVFEGVDPSQISNTQNDGTTMICNGSEISNQITSYKSEAPIISYESTNNQSGVRFNLEGIHDQNAYRWQIDGDTKLQMNNNGELSPGSASANSIGTTSIPFLNWNGSGYLAIGDGVPTPDTLTGIAYMFVDESDGALKVQFGNGDIKTVVLE